MFDPYVILITILHVTKLIEMFLMDYHHPMRQVLDRHSRPDETRQVQMATSCSPSPPLAIGHPHQLHKHPQSTPHQ